MILRNAAKCSVWCRAVLLSSTREESVNSLQSCSHTVMQACKHAAAVCANTQCSHNRILKANSGFLSKRLAINNSVHFSKHISALMRSLHLAKRVSEREHHNDPSLCPRTGPATAASGMLTSKPRCSQALS